MSFQADRMNKRFKAMAGNGLVDVKFSLVKRDSATVEDVCADVNRMLDACERGETVELNF